MSPTWRNPRRKRSAPERPQCRLRLPALRAPKDKAFSVWEVLNARNPAAQRERAFLVGIEVRTRGRSGAKGAVTAQASAARDAAGLQPSKAGAAAGGPGKSNGKPRIPEFDADESLAELRTLAESAGAEVVGEILQRRDRPDPATLIGAGKLEEIAGAAASG